MSSVKMWRKPRERLRYTNEHSLMLLKEVLDRNPFEDPYRWSTVHENFVRMTSRPHTLRSVREHVDYLLKLYVKGDLENSKARYKGSDDEHAEKLQMLQEVLALKEKYFDVIQEKRPTKETRTGLKRTRSETSSNEDIDESTDMFLDEDLNDDSLALPQTSGSVSSSINQDNSLSNIVTLQFLKTKHTAEMDIRKSELELRERKLTQADKEYKLAREKFDLEKQERLRRLELEQHERSRHLKILEQQQKLIQMFFDQHK